MDKNMINIDDLFRQRLQGGEENERAGAWANMSALLDKEMPVAPAAFNFRRLAFYLVGGLMLAALSVGGYKSYERLHSDRNLLGEENAHVVSVSNSKTLNSSNIRTSNTSNTLTTETGNNNTIAGNTIAKPAITGSNRNAANHISAASTRNTTTAENTISRQPSVHQSTHSTNGHNAADNQNTTADQLTASVSATNTSNSHSGNTARDAQQLNNAATGNQASVATINSNNSHSFNTSAITAPAGLQQHNIANSNQNYLASNTGNSHTGNTIPGNITGMTGNGSVPPSSGSNVASIVPAAAGGPQKAPTGFTFIKDTIQKIRLLQHYVRDAMTHANVLRVDTISVEHNIIDRLIKQDNQELAAINKPAPRERTTQPGGNQNTNGHGQSSAGNSTNGGDPITPVPNSASAAADSKDLAPLENYKVASKRSYAWDPERFREMVMHAKFNLAQVQFYPGLVAGINATMGPNAMAGFQLGLSGVFALNDRWSILSELKYVTRFNHGSTIKDNYAGAPVDSFAKYNAQGTALETMNYNRDSVEHYFNFSTVSSLELPLSVRYAIKRLYLMGGINFAYYFTVNAEEVSRTHEIITTVPYNHGPLSWPSGKQGINLGDFDSRFGIGYLLGAGYQITPAVNVDLRMTKTFWDNANGAGAQKVSTDLFKSPSMQLSIGYRFRQNRH